MTNNGWYAIKLNQTILPDRMYYILSDLILYLLFLADTNTLTG